ncbi:MAG: LptF/LptG family permease [Planctomycetota bacterium]|jgi:lipopolysaccharide export system permease protein
MQIKFLPKVDTYVTKSVLFFFVLCTLTSCFLVAIVDATQRVDDFVNFAKRENYGVLATTYLLAKYYLCLTPQYFIQYLVPFTSMLAGVSVISVMSSHREFTALRASGIPLQRVLAPIIISVFLFGFLVFIIRDTVLPSLAREANAVSLMVKPRGGKPVTIVIKDDKKKTIETYMMGHFDSNRQIAYNFRLEVRKLDDIKKGKTNIYEVFTDDDAKLVGSEWKMGMHPRHSMKGHYEEKLLPNINIATSITPAMLEQQTLGFAVMTANDLAAFPDDIDKQIELAQRRAAPFAGLIIMLIGISFILKRERENPGSRVGRVKSIIFAIFICVGYYITQGISTSMAESESIGPNTAAWLSNLSFGSWGVYSFRHVNL